VIEMVLWRPFIAAGKFVNSTQNLAVYKRLITFKLGLTFICTVHLQYKHNEGTHFEL